jgi:hypothetical protein
VQKRPQPQRALQRVVRLELQLFGHDGTQIREPLLVVVADERAQVFELRQPLVAAAMRIEHVGPRRRESGERRLDLRVVEALQHVGRTGHRGRGLAWS